MVDYFCHFALAKPIFYMPTNAENASLWNFGTGNMKAWAASDMDCGIYGTGSIYYRGHPI
ncbi:MAG: hypothetical protein AB8G86_14525 [Saprospiraceae bacterium]